MQLLHDFLFARAHFFFIVFFLVIVTETVQNSVHGKIIEFTFVGMSVLLRLLLRTRRADRNASQKEPPLFVRLERVLRRP